MSIRTTKRGRCYGALVLGLLLALIVPLFASADTVVNDLVPNDVANTTTNGATKEILNLSAGGPSATVGFYIIARGSDGNATCNFAGGGTVTFQFNIADTSKISIDTDPSTSGNQNTLLMNQCSATANYFISVTPLAAGSSDVNLACVGAPGSPCPKSTGGNTTDGTFNLFPARFTVVVAANTKPSAPGAPVVTDVDANPTADGVFTLAWTASTDAENNPLTYTLQRQDSDDASFTTVASGLTSATYSFTAGSPEAEGHVKYRVIANDGTLDSDPSPESVVYLIDRTAPTTPTATADRAPEYTDATPALWFKDAVTVAFSGSADPNLSDGSAGAGGVTYTAPQTFNTAGAHTATGYAFDAVNNQSGAATLTLNVDADAPTFDCGTQPTGWQGANVTLSCTASDVGSGLTNPTPSTFTLGTGVLAGTDDAAAQTGTQVLCDNVGHCVTAGPYTFMVDLKNPTFDCGALPTGWQANNVTLSCAAADSGAGLDNASPAAFQLATNVAAGAESSNAQTNTQQLCDAVGNCLTAGPYTFMVDRKAPTISLTAPSNATYQRFSTIAAQYSCADGGSGVATCAGTVANGANIDTSTVGPHTFTVNASDAVGNSTQQSVMYTINAPMAVDGIAGIRSTCNGKIAGCLKLGVQIEAQQRGVPGATVAVDVSTPTGVVHLTASTSATGAAGFSVPITGPGNYTLTVTGVSAPYYTYVPGNNTQTTRTFTIGSR